LETFKGHQLVLTVLTKRSKIVVFNDHSVIWPPVQQTAVKILVNLILPETRGTVPMLDGSIFIEIFMVGSKQHMDTHGIGRWEPSEVIDLSTMWLPVSDQ